MEAPLTLEIKLIKMSDNSNPLNFPKCLRCRGVCVCVCVCMYMFVCYVVCVCKVVSMLCVMYLCIAWARLYSMCVCVVCLYMFDVWCVYIRTMCCVVRGCDCVWGCVIVLLG